MGEVELTKWQLDLVKAAFGGDTYFEEAQLKKFVESLGELERQVTQAEVDEAIESIKRAACPSS